MAQPALPVSDSVQSVLPDSDSVQPVLPASDSVQQFEHFGAIVQPKFASIDIRLKQAEEARVKLNKASNEKVAILKI
jgi:hypothetical protein